MVNVDISNIWCSVSLPALLESEQEIAAAHGALMDGAGANFLPWLAGDPGPELERVRTAAEAIGSMAQVLVVVGGGAAALGARAVLELLRGRDHGLRSGLQVVFAGSDLSTAAWQNLCELLESRDFCVQILSRDGEDLPTAVTARGLRWLLERRYGTEKARERVFVTTDATRGALRALSVAEGYTTFNLPRNLEWDETPLCPGALLAPAAAGVDVEAVLRGAASIRPMLEGRSFDNPAWLYAAGRTILARRGRRVEYLTSAEPDAWTLCRWWQRLFGGRSCLGGEGLLPAMAELPADLPQLHQLLADGAAPLVQTVVRFEPPEHRVPVEMDWQNLDHLNYLEGYTLDYVLDQVLAGAVQAGVDGGVPIVMMDCGRIAEVTVGELLYFFELTSCLAAGMLGRDVYEAEEPAAWAARAAELLGRPRD